MHCIVLRNNLKDGFSIIANARKEGGQLSSLKNVLIEAKENKIHLSTTDLEIGVVHTISAKVLIDGVSAVPFGIFQQIIQNANAERIELELKGSVLRVSTDNYNAKITTATKEDFPIIPDIEKEKSESFAVETTTFSQALQIASTACHVSEFRPELSGVLLDMRDGCIYVVATDSFRLARVIIPKKKIDTHTQTEGAIIVPLRTVHEVIRIFSTEQKQITVNFDESQIVFKNEHTRFVSRLIDGKFPDYSMVIPKSFESEIAIAKNELIQALRLTSSLSNRLHEIRLKIDDSLKSIQLLSSSHEFGESEYILPAKTKGLALMISYNWRFLLDGLKHVQTEEVFIGINSEQKPSLIQVPNDDSYVYVLTSIKAG